MKKNKTNKGTYLSDGWVDSTQIWNGRCPTPREFLQQNWLIYIQALLRNVRTSCTWPHNTLSCVLIAVALNTRIFTKNSNISGAISKASSAMSMLCLTLQFTHYLICLHQVQQTAFVHLYCQIWSDCDHNLDTQMSSCSGLFQVPTYKHTCLFKKVLEAYRYVDGFKHFCSSSSIKQSNVLWSSDQDCT